MSTSSCCMLTSSNRCRGPSSVAVYSRLTQPRSTIISASVLGCVWRKRNASRTLFCKGIRECSNGKEERDISALAAPRILLVDALESLLRASHARAVRSTAPQLDISPSHQSRSPCAVYIHQTQKKQPKLTVHVPRSRRVRIEVYLCLSVHRDSSVTPLPAPSSVCTRRAAHLRFEATPDPPPSAMDLLPSILFEVSVS